MAERSYGMWVAAPVPEVARLMRCTGLTWWLAGGEAVDHHVGRATREHDDVDVVVLHRDHGQLREALADWDLWVADPPGVLRAWPVGERLVAKVRDVWGRRSSGDPWSVQVMLDLVDGDDWVYRRDPRIRRPLASMWALVGEVPVIAPEVQLLWKSSSARERDDWDFEVLLPRLTPVERAWLDDALALVDPRHRWRRWL